VLTIWLSVSVPHVLGPGPAWRQALNAPVGADGPYVVGVVRAECASNAHDMAASSGGERPYRRAIWVQ
jgi:hypothetical protein